MLLTLPRPSRLDFEFKHAHDFIPPPRFTTQRTTSKAAQDSLPPLQSSSLDKMGTPHRGLPPPSLMTLPELGRNIPPPISTSSFAGMPEPPRQWQGAEDSMNRWLSTKAEEEKRKQEEEKTRQESLRLEQRRIEQTILLDALRSGVPPHLVPIIFAGIGSPSLANLNVESLQQYNNTLQSAHQQQLTGQSQTTGSPDARRERLLAGPQPYLHHSQPQSSGGALPPPPLGPSGVPYGYGSNPISPTMRPQQPMSAPSSSSYRTPTQQVLPRLPMEEQRSSQPHVGPGPSIQQAQAQVQGGQAEPSQSSPGGGIFFHHWQPPTSSSSQSVTAGHPPTPSEYSNSPKRRKVQASQPPSVPPMSESRYNASSFVHVNSPTESTSGGRKRRLSETSTSVRPSYATTGRRNRSRGNTESSAPVTEEDRNRYRQQYPVSVSVEERNVIGGNYKRSRRVHDHAEISGPRSPKQEHASAALGDRNSYGPTS